MKLKLITLCLISTLCCFSQEERSDKCIFLIGLGGGGNEGTNGLTVGGSFTYNHKFHTFTGFSTYGHRSDHLYGISDRMLRYRSSSSGLIYGPGYFGKYVACNIGTGIAFVKTLQMDYYNPTPGSPMSSVNFASHDVYYETICFPVQCQASVHGKSVGLTVQYTSLFSPSHHDYRILCGLTFGMH